MALNPENTLISHQKVNPSAPRYQCGGLLRVDPERRFPSPPLKVGLDAVERLKFGLKGLEP